jgi:hypothetical protein
LLEQDGFGSGGSFCLTVSVSLSSGSPQRSEMATKLSGHVVFFGVAVAQVVLLVVFPLF